MRSDRPTAPKSLASVMLTPLAGRALQPAVDSNASMTAGPAARAVALVAIRVAGARVAAVAAVAAETAAMVASADTTSTRSARATLTP